MRGQALRAASLHRLCLLLALLLPVAAPATERVIVAAAADLAFVLDRIVDAYPDGAGIRISYGSSGNIYTQIRQGAPFELFLSADEQLIFGLAADGHARDRGRLYAIGRLVLYVPTGSPLALDASLADLGQALRDGRLRRFAIANPEHAPYGRAARQALEHNGLWSAILPHLALGENVAQAAQFARSGAAQGGIIALSLALAPDFDEAGRHVLLDEAWHAPLRQRMALMRGASPAATAFYTHLGSAAARRVFARYGFTLPQD